MNNFINTDKLKHFTVMVLLTSLFVPCGLVVALGDSGLGLVPKLFDLELDYIKEHITKEQAIELQGKYAINEL